MPRKRTIKPGFFLNEDLGACTPLARLFFAGLWCWADREGRLEDRPRRLQAEILPYDREADGEALISELARHGFVLRYEVEGKCLLQIVNFHEHQDPHPRETPSELPGPTQGEPLADQGSPNTSKGSTSPSRPSRSLDPRELPLVVEASASDDAGPFERIAKVWEETCVPAGFAKARATPQQRKQAATRMREKGWFDAFELACKYMAVEPFYRGSSSSGWVATLGWLLKPGNAEKTAERAVTKRATGPPVFQTLPPPSRPDEFVGGERPMPSWEELRAKGAVP